MEVKKRPNETVGSLLRRFSRLAQQSKILVKAKRSRFFQKGQSLRQEKNRAIMREKLKSLRKRLERLGKYNEETFEEEKRKIKQAA